MYPVNEEQETFLGYQKELIAAVEAIPWSTRIWVADEVGFFTDEDHTLASQWFSCAVGEHTGHRQASPIEDSEEDTLGMDFYHAVCADDPEEAINLYYQIQALYQ